MQIQTLSKNVEIVEHPVFSESDLELYYHDNGPGSRISSEPIEDEKNSVTTLSIDDLVERKKNIQSRFY